MDKVLALKKIKEAMERDKNLPLVKKPEDVIPGDGNPNAEIMFIGEAGGYYESLQRKPFVGAAGQLLNRLFKEIGIIREEVYISNMVKTRPPNNRDPFPEELRAFERYLDEEIEIIQPYIIITLGRFSMRKFLPGAKITAIHGKPQRVNFKSRQITVIPMYHPAAALRSTEIMMQLKHDFLQIPQIIKEARGKIEVQQMQLV